MTWPSSDVVTTNVDAGTDNPATARAQLLDLVQKFNQLRAHVSAAAQALLDDADAAAMRSTLGLVIGTNVLAPNGDGSGLTGITTVPAGAVSFFAMSTPPAGWLKANGALVSRTTYAALFAAIGTTYGAGDGSTTFALPDARGEFLRAWTDGSSVDSGRVFGSKQAATGFGSYVGPSATLYYTEADSTDGVGLSYFSIGGAGISGVYARVKPRNIAFLACIKY